MQVARKWTASGAASEEEAPSNLDFSRQPSASEGEHLASANGSAVDLGAKSRVDVSDDEEGKGADTSEGVQRCRGCFPAGLACITLARNGSRLALVFARHGENGADTSQSNSLPEHQQLLPGAVFSSYWGSPSRGRSFYLDCAWVGQDCLLSWSPSAAG